MGKEQQTHHIKSCECFLMENKSKKKENKDENESLEKRKKINRNSGL